MAVRTDWDEVLRGVNPVAVGDLGERYDVMDMDEPSECIAVDSTELEAADDASGAVPFDAFQTCLSTPLVGIDSNRASGPFPKI
jgi:hypothetical protein